MLSIWPAGRKNNLKTEGLDTHNLIKIITQSKKEYLKKIFPSYSPNKRCTTLTTTCPPMTFWTEKFKTSSTLLTSMWHTTLTTFPLILTINPLWTTTLNTLFITLSLRKSNTSTVSRSLQELKPRSTSTLKDTKPTLKPSRRSSQLSKPKRSKLKRKSKKTKNCSRPKPLSYLTAPSLSLLLMNTLTRSSRSSFTLLLKLKLKNSTTAAIPANATRPSKELDKLLKSSSVRNSKS